jgi:ribosomal protein S21
VISVAKVVRREGESFENLFRRFRKKVNRARILSAAKKSRYYVPKSERRQIARRKAIQRERKRQNREDRRRMSPYRLVLTEDDDTRPKANRSGE